VTADDDAQPAAGEWLADPWGRAEVRYRRGGAWTTTVATGGVVSTEPLDVVNAPEGSVTGSDGAQEAVTPAMSGAPAVCQVDGCGVLATGRCASCDRAYCGSHEAKAMRRIGRSQCGPCAAEQVRHAQQQASGFVGTVTSGTASKAAQGRRAIAGWSRRKKVTGAAVLVVVLLVLIAGRVATDRRNSREEAARAANEVQVERNRCIAHVPAATNAALRLDNAEVDRITLANWAETDLANWLAGAFRDLARRGVPRPAQLDYVERVAVAGCEAIAGGNDFEGPALAVPRP
jgi:hypothetical protein